MTLTHYTLDDVGGALSWGALLHFVRNLPPTSRYMRETHPELDEVAPWLNGYMVAPLLADLIDSISYERWEYAVAHSKKGHKPRKPKRVPRPWAKPEKGERHIGKDPIPISEFEQWWESKGK